MKRFCILLLPLLLLILPGCGHPTATAYGYIVDQAGNPMVGLTVTLDGYSAVSGAGGRFDLSGLAAGTFTISGAGSVMDTDPEPDHYLFAPVERTIVVGEANYLGTLTVYNMIGFGVIIQPVDEPRTRTLTPALKRIDPAELAAGPPTQSRAMRTPVSESYLSSHICFIFLDWAPIATTVDHYAIYLDGVSTPVWVSTGTHGDDPEPEPGYQNISAYLDLSDELTQITSADDYTFHIRALDAVDGLIAELPAIEISLGMTLNDHPWLDDYTEPDLTWSAVTQASGYRLRVYTDAAGVIGTRLYDSGNTLLSTTSLSTSLIDDLVEDYYHVRVDAQYLDATGWPAEITRGIGGFTY